MSAGVIISTNSLVLQKVSRLHTGNYTCVATNERGETSSKPVSLRVQCEYIEIIIYSIFQEEWWGFWEWNQNGHPSNWVIEYRCLILIKQNCRFILVPMLSNQWYYESWVWDIKTHKFQSMESRQKIAIWRPKIWQRKFFHRNI